MVNFGTLRMYNGVLQFFFLILAFGSCDYDYGECSKGKLMAEIRKDLSSILKIRFLTANLHRHRMFGFEAVVQEFWRTI